MDEMSNWMMNPGIIGSNIECIVPKYANNLWWLDYINKKNTYKYKVESLKHICRCLYKTSICNEGM